MSDDWKRDYVVPVPLPIPAGKMIGMREEMVEGELRLVEFLEDVPGYQPNPFSRETKGDRKPQKEDVLISWSARDGFTVYDGKPVQERLF